ncbi:MAG: hypothetical protein MUD03_04760, partial [Pirellula sp.]|nr:hypothetical protein [Pirellula sp.]
AADRRVRASFKTRATRLGDLREGQAAAAINQLFDRAIPKTIRYTIRAENQFLTRLQCESPNLRLCKLIACT